jgi:Binding-protein-dependent transport system inner membrane component
MPLVRRRLAGSSRVAAWPSEPRLQVCRATQRALAVRAEAVRRGDDGTCGSGTVGILDTLSGLYQESPDMLAERDWSGTAVASLAAFAFSQLRFPGRDVIFFVLLAGLMVPDQVLIVPRFVIMRELDWFDTYQGLIVPLVFSSFGVFLLRQYFLGIPRDFHEAAKLEGANPLQALTEHDLVWPHTLDGGE